ncbi:MAG: hypothetical protein BVN34_10555 [Proteobacteria bacterium ST_bin12]|nr:MAG: hypothetical protein BVN34_10555 [Proteobacteria bacterium ST_bin12]
MPNNRTDYFVKDVKILNEDTVHTENQLVTLIVGSSSPFTTEVVSVKNPFITDKLVTLLIEDKVSAQLHDFDSLKSISSLARGVRNALLNRYYLLSPAHKIQSTIFDVRSIEPNNIAHLIVHIIPLCLYVRSIVGSDIQFLFRKVSPSFKKLLAEFGIIPLSINKKIQGTFVRLYAKHRLARYNILDNHSCHPSTFLSNIYDQYQFKSPLINKKKLFISRRGARGLLNHDETAVMLEQRGYETIFMEDYNMSEQLGIASEASHVVAVHGASMGMLVLNKHIENLIEIMPPNVYEEYFGIALAGCVQKHIQIISSFDEEVAYNGWSAIVHFKNKPFSVNLSQLSYALDLNQ